MPVFCIFALVGLAMVLCLGSVPSGVMARTAASWGKRTPASLTGARAIVSESAGGGYNSAPMAFDAHGDLWVSDVRGVGLQEFSPADAPLSFVPIHNPSTGRPEVLGSVTFDRHDDIFAYGNRANQIWEFSPQGRYIRAIGSPGSGRGQYGAVGDIAVSETGKVYVADLARSRVDEYSATGAWIGLLGNGTKGRGPGSFNRPSDVVIDRYGNVYVADAGNNRVERFSANGRLTAHWSIVHGGYADLYSIAVGPDNSVYVIDSTGDRLDRYSASGRLIWAASAAVHTITPVSVAIGPSGQLFAGNHSAIYRISSTGSAGQHFALPGTTISQLSSPSGIAVDTSGNVVVANTCYLVCTSGLVVIRFGAKGTPIWTRVGNATVVSAVAVSGHGSIYTGSGSDTVQKFIAKNSSQARWQLAFRGSEPTGITAIASSGHGKLYASDYNGFLWSFSPRGHLLDLVGRFRHILGIAIDRTGDVYVADVNAYLVIVGQRFPTQQARVIELSAAGRQLHVWSTPVISSLAIDARGHVYAAEYNLDRIAEFSPAMKPLAHWGGYGFSRGKFDHPSGIALDRSGHIYVADTDNDRVQELSSNGRPLHVWGIRYGGQ